jgi:hypothetical protein
MATTAQERANQANASHSTGPRTPEGKARVSRNACKHGLTSQRLIVREDELEEFESLHADLLAELDPQGALETLTFNEILHSAWNLSRYRRIEAGLSPDGPDPIADPASGAMLDRLARYQARAQRAYYHAIKELRTLQTNRALRALKLTEEEAAELPAITDINELTN